MPGYADVRELSNKTCHCSIRNISSPEAESAQPEAGFDRIHAKLPLVGNHTVCAAQSLVSSRESHTMAPVRDA